MRVRHYNQVEIHRVELKRREIKELTVREYQIIQKALEYYAMKLEPAEGSKEDAELAYAMFDEMRQNQ